MKKKTWESKEKRITSKMENNLKGFTLMPKECTEPSALCHQIWELHGK